MESQGTNDQPAKYPHKAGWKKQVKGITGNFRLKRKLLYPHYEVNQQQFLPKFLRDKNPEEFSIKGYTLIFLVVFAIGSFAAFGTMLFMYLTR